MIMHMLVHRGWIFQSLDVHFAEIAQKPVQRLKVMKRNLPAQAIYCLPGQVA
jgi:hypothetical protein